LPFRNDASDAPLLSAAEVAAEVARELASRREFKLRSLKRAMRLFKQADLDLSGSVDIEELRAIMPACLKSTTDAAGAQTSSAAAEWLADNVSTTALLQHFDVDGDSQLDLKEFITLYKSVWRVERRFTMLTQQREVATLLLDALQWRVARVTGAVNAASGVTGGVAHSLLEWNDVPVSVIELLPFGASSALTFRCLGGDDSISGPAPLALGGVVANEARLDALATLARVLNAAERGSGAALKGVTSPQARQLLGVMLLAEGARGPEDVFPQADDEMGDEDVAARDAVHSDVALDATRTTVVQL
jgi:hypothetical protein